MRFIFLLGFITFAYATPTCPYQVGDMWSCGTGTRPCVANTVTGFKDKCPDQKSCSNDCWSGTTCKECVWQDKYLGNGLDQFDRQQCIENKEGVIHIVLFISYSVILVVLTGFFIRTLI